MISGIFHEGSGLGDQLFRYITVRSLAEKKGWNWGMKNPQNFKGDFFNATAINLPGALDPDYNKYSSIWNEKEVRDMQGNDIRSYDPEINFIEEPVIIDGSFEDDKYWRYNLNNINEWLAVEPLNVPEDLCIIGFRGGEYYSDPNLGLPKAYFLRAITEMSANIPIGLPPRFQVHTEDTNLAAKFFPDIEIVQNQEISHSKHSNMGYNWRSARYAKYAIIPNSAFFIIPRILKHYEDPTAVTVAPRYWARRNTRIWARPACYYPEFRYL